MPQVGWSGAHLALAGRCGAIQAAEAVAGADHHLLDIPQHLDRVAEQQHLGYARHRELISTCTTVALMPHGTPPELSTAQGMLSFTGQDRR